MRRTALVLGASVLLAVAVSAATAAAPRKYTVEVLYAKRACAAGPARPARVTAGTLELRRQGTATVRVSLLDDGTRPKKVAIPGRGPVIATLVLETPRVKVVDGAQSTTPIRVPLGRDVPEQGHLTFSVRRSSDADDERNGGVNTLIILQRAARLASTTSPRQLQKVLARLVGSPRPSGYSASFEKPATVHVRGAHWEPTPLAHEYGHFLLSEVAPDAAPGGDHHAARSYPAIPELAWSEGFPAAFAALVLDEGQGSLFVECGKPYPNLTATPAEPQLDTEFDRRFAQYNETRVGAAAYQLVTRHLGGGPAGLKRLLQALAGYRRDGHPVWTARDLRDLAALEFERSSADHLAIDKIFDGQRLSWFRQFGMSLDLAALGMSGMVSAIPELSVRVSGPGLSCSATGGDILPLPAGGTPAALDDGNIVIGVKTADGGLAFSANDDCYLFGGDGVHNPIGVPGALTGNVVLPFLYLGGLAHWAPGGYVLEALYVCQTIAQPPGLPPPNCPATAKVVLVLSTRNEFTPAPATYPDITVGHGSWTTIVAFTAIGKCTVVGAAAASDPDCSF